MNYEEFELTPEEFSRHITLASIEATYIFAADHSLSDLQEGVTDTFCRLFDIPQPEFFGAVGISLPNGAGDYH